MDMPVSDGMVNEAVVFNDTNPESVYYGKLPSELSMDKGILRVDKDGNLYSVQFSDEGVVVERQVVPDSMKKDVVRDNLLGTQLEKERYSIDVYSVANMMQTLTEDLGSYKRCIDAINYYYTDEGRKAYFEYEKEKFGVCSDKKMVEMADRMFANLQEGLSSSVPDIKEKPYLYFVGESSAGSAHCSYNRIIDLWKETFKVYGYNEDMIAGVLAHEMGHGERDHVAKGMLDDAGLVTSMRLLGIEGNEDMINVLSNHMKEKGVEQNIEREANYLSFKILEKSKYNLGAFAAGAQRGIDLENRVKRNSFNNESNVKKGLSVNEIFTPRSHPSSIEQRNTASKQLYDYSKGHVTVENGIVKIDGKDFVKPASIHDLGMKNLSFMDNLHYNNQTGAVRAYFVFGNLARAYHNGLENQSAYVKDGNTVMLGNQEIMKCERGDVSAEYLANKLNEMNHEIQKGRSNQTLSISNTNPEYLQVGNMTDYSYLNIYDNKGNQIDTGSPLMNIENKKAMDNFLKKMEFTVRDISQIDGNLLKEQVGQEVGKRLSTLLEEKDSVAFFQTVRDTVKGMSDVLVSEMNSQIKPNVKDLSNANNIIYKLGVNYADSKFSDVRQVESVPEYDFVAFNDTSTKKDLSKLLSTLSSSIPFDNSDLTRGFLKEISKNPEALKNYNEIVSIRDKTMRDIEKLRFNVLGKRIDLSAINNKKLESEYKKINKMLDGVKKNPESDKTFFGDSNSKKALTEFCYTANGLRRELLESQRMIEMLAKSNSWLHISKEEKQIHDELYKISDMSAKLKQKTDTILHDMKLSNNVDKFYTDAIADVNRVNRDDSLGMDSQQVRRAPIKPSSLIKDGLNLESNNRDSNLKPKIEKFRFANPHGKSLNPFANNSNKDRNKKFYKGMSDGSSLQDGRGS